MRTVNSFVLLVALHLLAPWPARAQQESELKPLRFDFTGFVGYRTSMSFPVEPHVAGTNPRVVVDASPSYGVSFGIRSREEDLIEVRWPLGLVESFKNVDANQLLVLEEGKGIVRREKLANG